MSDRGDSESHECGPLDGTDRSTSDDAEETRSRQASDDEDPKRLRGAQRRIVEAYFDADEGLFLLNCVPGAGKSFCRSDLVAREIVRRWAAGDRTPGQRVCVLTFNRDEASSMRTDIVDRLRTLVEYDRTPDTATVPPSDLADLEHRIQRAPYIGTIDGFLKTILDDIAVAVGFDTPPTVGNDALLERVHEECVDTLRNQQRHADAMARLVDAYPEREYAQNVGDLLRSMHEYRRRHRLSIDAFRDRLQDSVDAVYAEGPTTDIDDIASAIARCVSETAASETLEGLTDNQRRRLVAADSDLEQRWRERIDDVCSLLQGYTQEYATRIRDRGVVSHLDCAFLVAEFLDTDGHSPTLPSRDGQSGLHRDRVVDRYRERIDAWILDEAQDLSTVQHDALSRLVTAESTVFGAGDLRQSIYGFRGSHPHLFATAIEEGTYFGVDWETHVVEEATRTYRCRPDIAAAIDAIAEPALSDPLRGNLGDLDISYPRLDAVRDATQEPSVHVAAFETNAKPGTPRYLSPRRGNGEPEQLATYIASAFADGTLGPEECDCSQDSSDPDGVPERSASDSRKAATSDESSETPTCDCESTDAVVLFRYRKRMDTYARAFEAEGLSVANASEPLFEAPVVDAVCDVAAWLVDPLSTNRLRTLVQESALGLDSCEAVFEQYDWGLDAVVDDPPETLDDQQVTRLEHLRSLRDRRGIRHTGSLADLGNEIIQGLDLSADPHEFTTARSPSQRVANLDAFRDWLQDQSAGDHDESGGEPPRFVALTDPFRDDPSKGPRQPVVSDGSADVVFETVHGMKGDEADIVAVADLGSDIWWPGTPNQRFVTSKAVAALAPPERGLSPSLPSDFEVTALDHGLNDPPAPDCPDNDDTDADDGARTAPSERGSDGPSRDIGLRWATEQWGHDGDERPSLLGHDHLQTVTRAKRAETFRLLYVALTRAREHFVVPLPRHISGGEQPRNRWLETIRSGMGFDGSPRSGTYTVEVPPTDTAEFGTTGDSHRSFTVGVNDVTWTSTGFDQSSWDTAGTGGDPISHRAGETQLDTGDLEQFVPRIVRPSTLSPLSEAPDEWMLEHLLNEEVHSRSSSIDPDLPIHGVAVPPEDLGRVIHEILTSALYHHMRGGTSTRGDFDVASIAERRIDQELEGITSSDRRKILRFVSEDLRSQVVNAECWSRIESAENLYLEKPLPGQRRIGDLTFELDGNADVVLEHYDGSWEIIELKIALGELQSETRSRYADQVATYGDLLDNYSSGEIRTQICIIGSEQETIKTDVDCAKLERLLKNI